MAWREAIIWTSGGQITDTYMRHSVSMTWVVSVLIDDRTSFMNGNKSH